MIAYRVLAHGFQKRVGINFETALAVISFTIKSIAHQLTLEEAAIFKRSIPIELRQLVSDARAKGAHDARQIIGLIADQLELKEHEAKRRAIGLLEELRLGVSPWDEVEFVELIDRLRFEIEQVSVESAAA